MTEEQKQGEGSSVRLVRDLLLGHFYFILAYYKNINDFNRFYEAYSITAFLNKSR